MSHLVRKVLIDCTGEILEAAQNVPLLAVNGHLTDEAMKAFSEMQIGWAKEYLKWKKTYVDFDS